MPIESLSDVTKGGTSAFAAGGGSGDVVGPASSVANYVPQWSNTTGKLLKAGLPVQTSTVDVTAGALLTMGAFGLPTVANYLALPKPGTVNGTTDFNVVTNAGYYYRILGNTAGSRNANHPDGQTAVTADSGVCDYYYVCNFLYDAGLGNSTQLAIPYIYGADTAKATIKMRHFYGGTTWSPWKSVGGGGGSDPSKQDVLVSGTNIKTVNSQSILGAGNLVATGAATVNVACGDETTAITAGTGKVIFRMPHGLTLTSAKASLVTPQPSGALFTVDVKQNGASIFTTPITIENGAKTSFTAVTPAAILDTTLSDDAEMSVDVTQVGASGAAGLKLYLIGVAAAPPALPLQVLVRSSSEAISASTATLTIPKPAGTTDGDILVAFIMSEANAAVTFTGWTLQRQFGNILGRFSIFTKVASSEPASWDYTSATGRMTAEVVCVKNATAVDTSSLVPDTDSGATTIAPSITTTANGLLLAGFFNTGNGSTTTGPAEMALVDNISLIWQQINVYSQNVGTGATGTRTAVWVNPGSSTQGLICIR